MKKNIFKAANTAYTSHVRFLIGTFVILVFISSSIKAQNSDKRIFAKFITEPISLDGVLDEQAWQSAESTDSFWQYFPTDSVQAQHQTTVKIVYDDQMLYVGIHADAPHGNYVVSTLKRDFGGTSNDNISLM